MSFSKKFDNHQHGSFANLTDVNAERNDSLTSLHIYNAFILPPGFEVLQRLPFPI